MNHFFNEPYFNYKIDKRFHQKTLIQFLNSFDLAKSKIKYLIENENCFINGEIALENSILKINDYLSIDVSKFERLDFKEEDIPLDIVYEDDFLLIINKPLGKIIYPDSPDGTNTIANMVASYYKKNHLNLTIRHCHRLDKDTTGCLVFAKDLITHAKCESMFSKGEISKTYWAIVDGVVKKPGVIKSPIGKDRHVNSKMVISKTGKNALTSYKPLSSGKNHTLLEVKISTGKTHQIRVHLSSIGFPLFGDELYGSKEKLYPMLHCKVLSFKHPITNEALYIESSLPNAFKETLKKLI